MTHIFHIILKLMEAEINSNESSYMLLSEIVTHQKPLNCNQIILKKRNVSLLRKELHDKSIFCWTVLGNRCLHMLQVQWILTDALHIIPHTVYNIGDRFII